MASASDNAAARELTRMTARYVASLPDDQEHAACKAAGISTTRWLGYWEGLATMSLPVIVALSRVLGMTPGELLRAAEARHRG